MKNNHLSLDDRKHIQEGLEKELTITEISKIINKDISAVAKEMVEIIDIIKPLLKQGQSVYQILKNHPEINLSFYMVMKYLIN